MSNESENERVPTKRYRVRVYVDHFFDVIVEADNEQEAIAFGAEHVADGGETLDPHSKCTWFNKTKCGIVWDACEVESTSE